MDYRNIALSEFSRFAEETKEYFEEGISKTLSVGNVILAIIKRKPEGANLNEWLRDISDEDIFTTIEDAKLKERP